MKPQSYWDQMKEKHGVKQLKAEPKASLSTHITGYSGATKFWQTWTIWVDLCLPECKSHDTTV